MGVESIILIIGVVAGLIIGLLLGFDWGKLVGRKKIIKAMRKVGIGIPEDYEGD